MTTLLAGSEGSQFQQSAEWAAGFGFGEVMVHELKQGVLNLMGSLGFLEALN